MKYLIPVLFVLSGFVSCTKQTSYSKVSEFGNILEISYTPTNNTRCRGWFTDAGAWYGFTPPAKDKWINGFCGPYHLDMNRRRWISESIVKVCFEEEDKATVYNPDTTIYYPGKLYMKASSEKGTI